MANEMEEQKKLRRDELELRRRETSLQEKKWDEEKEDRKRRAEADKATLDLLKLLMKKLE